MRDSEGKIYWRGEQPEGSPDGGSYWIRFTRFGKDVRISAKTNLKSEARKMLRREIAKAQSDTWIDPQDRKVKIERLVTDLVEHFKAKQMARAAADVQSRWDLHLKAAFDSVPAHALTTAMINRYRASRFAPEDKPAVATVNREVQVLRRAYKLAAKCDPPKVGRVPVFELDRERNACQEFFTYEQLEKVRAAAAVEGAEWIALVELAYSLGWRRGELLGLRVGDFDLLAGTVRIEMSKNGQPREGVLTERLKMAIQPLLSGKTADDRIFKISGDTFRYPWRRISKAAGVKKFHSFRRTSAKDKRAVDVPASVIMEEMGWTSEAMFRRYAITTREDKLRSQQKLEQLQAENRTKAAQNQVPTDEPAKPRSEQVQ